MKVQNPYARKSQGNAPAKKVVAAVQSSSQVQSTRPANSSKKLPMNRGPTATVPQKKTQLEKIPVNKDAVAIVKPESVNKEMVKKNDSSKQRATQPSLRMKLKKEIEALKRQKLRQQERAKAELHRRKLEIQAEKQKKEARRLEEAQRREKELQKQAESALPTPLKSSGLEDIQQITPSPDQTSRTTVTKSADSLNNETTTFGATNYIGEQLYRKDVSPSKDRNSKALSKMNSLDSSGVTVVVRQPSVQSDCQKDGERAQSEAATHQVKEDCSQLSCNVAPVPPVQTDQFVEKVQSEAAIRSTNGDAIPALSEASAANQPSTLPTAAHTSFVPQSTISPATMETIPTAYTDSYVHDPTQRGFSGYPHPNIASMFSSVENYWYWINQANIVGPFPQSPEDYYLRACNPFYMQATQPMTMQQNFYNPQLYPYGASSGPSNYGAFYSHQQQPVNPWTMTLTATSMGHALPQANTLRRERVSKSVGTRGAAKPATQEGLITPTPCLSPSPFAATHEIYPVEIIMIKSAKGDPSFGVTVRRVFESALVGLEEWPFQQQNFSEKKSINPTTIPTGAAKMQDGFSLNESKEGKISITEANSWSETAKTTSVVSFESKLDELNMTRNSSLQSGNEKFGKSLFVDSAVSNSSTKHVAVSDNVESVTGYTADKLAIATSDTPAKKERRRRRRRMKFYVLQVLNPVKQNERMHPEKTEGMKLEQGDIILTIQGESTAHKTFEDACKLFATATTIDEHDHIKCILTIARRKKVVTNTPLLMPSRLPAVLKPSTGPLPASEIVLLVNIFLEVLQGAKRTLGETLQSEDVARPLRECKEFSSRSPDFLVTYWESMMERTKRAMKRRAVEHWNLLWQEEPQTIRETAKGPLSDAQRSSRRARPRPANGCRCGSADHDYVNDSNCPLYSNLRRLKADCDRDEDPIKIRKPKIRAPKDLNVVEKAFKERFVRKIAEESALEAEASFVDEMEAMQLEKVGKAVFAPGSLTAMVLSAIAELEPEFRDRKATSSIANEREIEDDDSDDDDVPLLSLGKRARASGSSPSKKTKIEPPIPLDYLAYIVRYVSFRWGHVYREPSDLDYAWRWEVYHGQLSSSASTDLATKGCKNPRRAGSLSLENIPFVLDEGVLNNLKQSATSSVPPDLNSLSSLAFTLLPCTTGIVDEILSLIKTSVLEVAPSGYPTLASNWYSHVDIILLDDMDSYWGSRQDPANEFGMASKMRTVLHKEWKKSDEGWFLVNEDPHDVVFEFAVFDEWRDAFEDKEQTKADTVEGVGRFGI